MKKGPSFKTALFSFSFVGGINIVSSKDAISPHINPDLLPLFLLKNKQLFVFEFPFRFVAQLNDWIILYHLFLIFYKAGIYLVSFWNPKAKLWITGRRNVFKKLKEVLQSESNEKRIWVHCASLGEFEQ